MARRLGVPSSGSLGAVFGRWSEVVGESLAAHSAPRSLRDGVLVVEVDDPAWATQLKWLSAQVIARVAEVANTPVERVEVRVEMRSKGR